MIPALLLKVTLVLLAGAAAALMLQRASAATRHLVWTLALGGTLLLTVASPVTPALLVPLSFWPRSAAPRTAVPAPAPAPVTVTNAPAPAINWSAPASTTTEQHVARASLPLATILGMVWLAGALAVLAWWALGRLGLAQLRRRATPLGGAEWAVLLRDQSARSGVIAPVVLLRSPEVGSPITWGVRDTVVMLPDDADRWPADRKRVVLAHELAHIARGDCLTQMLANITCALYWFHPIAWAAAHQLRAESESACDDLVLARGTPGAEYAMHLLDVAARSRHSRVSGMVAIGMARPSQLEGRLLAVLDAARKRSAPAHRVSAVSWIAVAALVLPLAALRPSEVIASRPAVAAISELSPVTVLASDAPRAEPRAPRVLPAPPVNPDSQDFVKTVAASPGEELVLQLETGAGVSIRAGGDKEVVVKGKLRGRDWASTRVSLERSGKRVILKSWMDRNAQEYSTSHSFDILVPAKFNVRLESAGGGLTVTGISGDFSGHTGGGDLEFDHAKGSAELSTGGGEINVRDSDLSGHLSTGGGEVNFTRVTGPLTASTGSGEVMYGKGKEGTTAAVGMMTDADGVLHIRKAGGSVSLDSAPMGAVIHTGGGRIQVGRSGGDVSANTGGGDIEIGPVNGSVTATTGKGDIIITITGANGAERSVEVTSGTGSLTLELPAGISTRFDLETAYTQNFGRRTKITSDFTLQMSETTEWDDEYGSPRKFVRGKGVLGSGEGRVRVRIVNGDIVIKKAR